MFTWRIHQALCDGRSDEIAARLHAFGDSIQFIAGPGRSLPPSLPFLARDCGGLALTTIDDACALLSARGWATPRLLYFDRRKYDVSYWLPRINPATAVLNRGALFVPHGLLGQIPVPLWSHGLPYPSGLLFVRPDSGLKPFPGIVLDCRAEQHRRWLDVAAAFQREIPRVAPEQWLCVAPGYALAPVEWRFWVVNRAVVASHLGSSDFSVENGVCDSSKRAPRHVESSDFSVESLGLGRGIAAQRRPSRWLARPSPDRVFSYRIPIEPSLLSATRLHQ